jgi:hypothetical protein
MKAAKVNPDVDDGMAMNLLRSAQAAYMLSRGARVRADRCAHFVDRGSWRRSGQCRNPAIVIVGARGYCVLHAPDARAAHEALVVRVGPRLAELRDRVARGELTAEDAFLAWKDA